MSNEPIESSAVDKIQSSSERVKKELKKVIIGQDEVIDQVLIAASLGDLISDEDSTWVKSLYKK